jgi:hypothetical protein
MFENITELQLMLLIRALNSERNVIDNEMAKSRHLGTGTQRWQEQREAVTALYKEAVNHPLNKRTFGERIRG